jgi:sortase A
MGERQQVLKKKRQTRLFALIAAAGVVLFGALLLGINILTSDEPVESVDTPASVADPEEMARAVQQEADYLARARRAAAERATQSAREEEAAPRASTSEPQPAIPIDTAMYLTVPKLGLYDVLVQEGTDEGILSQGAGHMPGTGYPWVEGSNTYIAGHRLGYPGTPSDHVFWDLPSLSAGDEIILEDSLGQVYRYQVTDVLEVSPYDLSVTGSTGADMVSLQTCIENYGDYWTAGPDWLARYIVQAQQV